MAYIVTDEYFIKELSIPNITDTRDVSSPNSFEQWIDKEARLLLKDALGYELFKDFDGYVDVSGVINPAAPTKWLNLVNGVEYTVDSVVYRWEGLIYSEGSFKGSLMAYFVYCKWLEYQMSQLSGMGEKRGQAVNAEPYNSTQRLTTLWNTFVDKYQSTECYFPVNYYYDGVLVTDYSPNGTSNFVSLIKFLEDNKTDYPDAALKMYDVRNQLGI